MKSKPKLETKVGKAGRPKGSKDKNPRKYRDPSTYSHDTGRKLFIIKPSTVREKETPMEASIRRQTICWDLWELQVKQFIQVLSSKEFIPNASILQTISQFLKDNGCVLQNLSRFTAQSALEEFERAPMDYPFPCADDDDDDDDSSRLPFEEHMN